MRLSSRRVYPSHPCVNHSTPPKTLFQYPLLAKPLTSCYNKNCTKVKKMHCFHLFLLSLFALFLDRVPFLCYHFQKQMTNTQKRALDYENQKFLQRHQVYAFQYKKHSPDAFYHRQLFRYPLLRYYSVKHIGHQNQSGNKCEHRQLFPKPAAHCFGYG